MLGEVPAREIERLLETELVTRLPRGGTNVPLCPSRTFIPTVRSSAIPPRG